MTTMEVTYTRTFAIAPCVFLSFLLLAESAELPKENAESIKGTSSGSKPDIALNCQLMDT